MSTRPVIVLEFNELCPNLMDRFIANNWLPNFKALRSQARVYVTEAGEAPPNLEPWIQWITLHTSLTFAEHKIFDLGSTRALDTPRIWDLVLADGRSAWICGSMNATVTHRGGDLQFLPDPWAAAERPAPPGRFDTFYTLISKFVHEHARARSPWSIGEYAAFGVYMLRNGLSLGTIKAAIAQLLAERNTPTARLKRALILDRLQWDVFRRHWRRERPAFSTFFLNSTAHLQHYYWRDFEPARFTTPAPTPAAQDAIPAGYKAMDDLVGQCMRMAPEATIVLATALSQQPLTEYDANGGKCIFKPSDLGALTFFAGIDSPYAYEPVMAEEFWLRFEAESAATQASEALEALRLGNEPLMRVRRAGASLYVGCAIIQPPAKDALVSSRKHNGARGFHDLFYQADGPKSGRHHPDGIFWIATRGSAQIDSGRIPLTEAAHLLAAEAGVRFKPKSASGSKDAAREPAEAR